MGGGVKDREEFFFASLLIIVKDIKLLGYTFYTRLKGFRGGTKNKDTGPTLGSLPANTAVD